MLLQSYSHCGYAAEPHKEQQGACMEGLCFPSTQTWIPSMLRVMGLHKHDLFLLTLQANVMPWLILLAPKLGAWVSAPAERVCHRASVGDSDTTQHNTSGHAAPRRKQPLWPWVTGNDQFMQQHSEKKGVKALYCRLFFFRSEGIVVKCWHKTLCMLLIFGLPAKAVMAMRETQPYTWFRMTQFKLLPLKLVLQENQFQMKC